MGSVNSRLKKYVEENAESYAIELLTRAVDANFNVNDTVTVTSDTLVHLSAKHGMVNLLKLLLNDRNGNVNLLNKNKQTALHKACQGANDDAQFQCVELILNWKHKYTNEEVKINAKDSDGNTALHYATMNNLKRCVEALIKHGADLFIVNNEKQTSCDVAEEQRQKEIALLLESEMVLNEKTSIEQIIMIDFEEVKYGLTKDDLNEIKEKLITETSSMLNCNRLTTEILLKHNLWSTEDLLKSWLDDPIKCCEQRGIKAPADILKTNSIEDKIKKVKKEVGLVFLQIKERLHHKRQQKITKPVILKCGICFNEIQPNNDETMFTVVCEHLFCKDCWKEYLQVKVEDGIVEIFCPEVDCLTTIPHEIIEYLLPPDVYLKYFQLNINDFVQTCAFIKWCPAPDCNTAICDPLFAETSFLKTYKIENKDFSKAVDCGKQHYYCWDCLKDAHEPASCASLNKWTEKIREMNLEEFNDIDKKEEVTANNLWFISKAKKCPNQICTAPIEKNEGCNHMKCVKCKHEFCWLCLNGWATHNTSECNNVLQTLTTEAENLVKEAQSEYDIIQDKNKFFHFYTRFKNHQQSYELEEPLLKLAKTNFELLKSYSINNDQENAINVKFIEDAIKELLKARSILSYSYVYSYYFNPQIPHKKFIFELTQTEYEEATECLSQIIARPYLKTPRSKIIQASKMLKSKRIEFLDTITKGLVLPSTPNNKSYMNTIGMSIDDIVKTYESEDEEFIKAVLLSVREQ